MPCGQYCYQRKWQCEGGRLRQLTNVQKQPGPTRNYGSENARENSIRRRVMSVKITKASQQYGPLFGKKKKPSILNNCGYCGDPRRGEPRANMYYNNGGTSGTNIYWNKIAVGSKSSGSLLGCSRPNHSNSSGIHAAVLGHNRLCVGQPPTLSGGAPCALGGKNWLNYRRFHPHGAKS